MNTQRSSIGHRWLLGFLGCASLSFLGTACTPSNPLAENPTAPPSTAPADATAVVGIPANPPVAQSSPDATAPAQNDAPPPLPVPQLIPPTSANAQVETIAVGRRDPFAPISLPPVVITPTASSNAPTAPPNLGNPSLPPVPQGNQPLQVVPIQNNPVGTVPTLNQPASNPGTVTAAAPTNVSLAQAIEIMGVVEVGGVTNVIVQVPNESTSRYVRVGDYLANGQVLVKRVETPSGGEPIVILQQDGVEFRRYIGGNSLLVGSRP